jgi:diaminohydroxyphosphoribosylaminopyrimidine deaminase / 5-amino-6-(5-phosphoribosylamino)uracil reductase
VGAGYHWGAGMPHAEVVALERAGERARGATLYVTLEPCCHFGRTPPCTNAIRAAGIARVVYGHRDPNPKVSGGGEAELKAAGIACERQELPQIETFYEVYDYWTRTRRPWVTAKLALSLDGRIAGPAGKRLPLTGAQAAKRTHQGRWRADAILTTIRTVLADDPRLDARAGETSTPKPVFVLDPRAEFPLEAQLWTTATGLVLFHGSRAPEERLKALASRGATCVAVAEDENGLNLDIILGWIGDKGYHSLWVEGGGKLFRSLLSGQKLNRALLYIAPVVVGEGTQAFTETQSQLAAARSVTWSTAGVDAVAEFSF